MSTVYRAFDTVLERTVAIKRMHRNLAENSEQLERFRREARAVAQLNHPHIVQVIDAGEHDDTPFIVFEHVKGETLKERIQRAGRLPVTEAVAYAVEIARALGAAHERGIVHRDVKPQNVMINEEGLAKVTDFGIARTLEEHGLTADGRVLGTTDYVSPEQAMGLDVTGQSDIYSLGIVLYEMLIGDIPFHGENQVAVAMKHVREELPDVQHLRPSIGAALAAVVDRATAKDLHVRYPSTDELIADLEDVLTIEASRRGVATGEATAVLRSLPPQQQQRVNLRLRRRGLLAVAALLVLVAFGAAAYELLHDRTTSGTAQRAQGPVPKNDKPISLSQGAAKDYNPYSLDPNDKRQHPEQAHLVVDGESSTAWHTETYVGGDLHKEGVGIFVDAEPSANANRIQVTTSTPGWQGKILAAKGGGPPPTDTSDGWTTLAEIPKAKRLNDIRFPAGTGRYRYYLVWITKLPADESSVAVNEIVLFAPST